MKDMSLKALIGGTRKDERANVVAYIRSEAEQFRSPDIQGALRIMANSIESGDHTPKDPDHA